MVVWGRGTNIKRNGGGGGGGERKVEKKESKGENEKKR